jgi:hypothetical protein
MAVRDAGGLKVRGELMIPGCWTSRNPGPTVMCGGVLHLGTPEYTDHLSGGDEGQGLRTQAPREPR